MTDDLVRRLDALVEDLREGRRCWPHEYISAAVDARDRIEALEAKLAKVKSVMKELAYWFDTDQEIFDAMSADGRANHERQVAKINRILAELMGGKDG